MVAAVIESGPQSRQVVNLHFAIAVFRRLADGSVAEASCDFTDAIPLAAGKTRNYDRRD
jgi:hypothetical protein